MKIVGVQCILTLFVCVLTANAQRYKAAVVEYHPIVTGSTPADIILENVEQYEFKIQGAKSQGADIIIFPEYGLTGVNNIVDISTQKLEEFSTFLPNVKANIAPCNYDTGNYSKWLIDLSCAAETSEIYTVVNLLEKARGNASGSTIFYNTNIVLDKKGVIIARYRKINLFNEPLLTPGNETVTFETDFGVTFGIFTCFDILFKNPAIDVLNNNDVKDIIFSTAWFSETPFLQALSLQSGYSKANGVNLLASNLNDAADGLGGSGIYFANGTQSVTFIEVGKINYAITEEIQSLPKRVPCNGNSITQPRREDARFSARNIVGFKTFKEDMSNYTFKTLDLSMNLSSESICSGSFCCSFNLSISNSTQSPFVYKLAAFDGVRSFGGFATGGIRVCSLVACLNDNSTTCGSRKITASKGPTFEKIDIRATILKKGNFHNQPATLTYNLEPIEFYSFCESTKENEIEIIMNLTRPTDSLLTFGIFGRVFDNDGKTTGSASISNGNTFIVLAISLVLFIAMER